MFLTRKSLEWQTKCAIVRPRLQHKEAGRLVTASQASPKPSTFLRKDEDYDYAY
jgi:hypothetical protein